MRKIDQDGLGVRFEAARQNLFEWYAAKYGSTKGLGVRNLRDSDGTGGGYEWMPNEAEAYFQACDYYEHRSICSIVYERFVRRALFVKARIRGLLR
jgi:hypothetical protein